MLLIEVLQGPWRKVQNQHLQWLSPLFADCWRAARVKNYFAVGFHSIRLTTHPLTPKRMLHLGASGATWTPKVCKTTAILAVFRCFGLWFYILLASSGFVRVARPSCSLLASSMQAKNLTLWLNAKELRNTFSSLPADAAVNSANQDSLPSDFSCSMSGGKPPRNGIPPPRPRAFEPCS